MKRAGAIAGILTLALIFRLVFLRWIQRTDWDGFFYLWYARNIMAGDWLNPSTQWVPYPPGYPSAVAGTFWITQSYEGGAVLVSLVCGVLLIIPVYMLAVQVSGKGAAWIAAILVALNSWMVRYSLSVLSESLFTTVLLLLMWLSAQEVLSQRNWVRWLFIAMLSIGLVFVRPIGLTVLAGGMLSQSLYTGHARIRLLVPYMLILIAASGLYFAYSGAVVDTSNV
jgi:4-amino-4-deoxy-L-arabinose transferase-like glycosyltransferase